MWGFSNFPSSEYTPFKEWDGTGDIVQGRLCWANPTTNHWPGDSCARPGLPPLGLCLDHREEICGQEA